MQIAYFHQTGNKTKTKMEIGTITMEEAVVATEADAIEGRKIITTIPTIGMKTIVAETTAAEATIGTAVAARIKMVRDNGCTISWCLKETTIIGPTDMTPDRVTTAKCVSRELMDIRRMPRDLTRWVEIQEIKNVPTNRAQQDELA